MADTLTNLEKAPVLLEDDSPVGFPAYSLTSADDSIALASNDGGTHYIIVGVSAGTTTYTVTRAADGVTATSTVVVTEAGGFTVHLGAAVPK